MKCLRLLTYKEKKEGLFWLWKFLSLVGQHNNLGFGDGSMSQWGWGGAKTLIISQEAEVAQETKVPLSH